MPGFGTIIFKVIFSNIKYIFLTSGPFISYKHFDLIIQRSTSIHYGILCKQKAESNEDVLSASSFVVTRIKCSVYVERKQKCTAKWQDENVDKSLIYYMEIYFYFDDRHTRFLKSDPRVYRKGFRAELMGSTNTAIHAYTSPEITWPLNASIPETETW